MFACALGVGGCGDAPEGGIGAPVGLESALTVCPEGETVYGIDVSKWQGTIDWAKVKADGVVYAFIRVSDGVNTFDSKFVRNWEEAKKQGILRGVYQYFRPNQDPVEQANLVLDNLALYGQGELPPVIDAEQSVSDFSAGSDYSEPIGIWIATVEAALNVRPIIYTGPSYWESKVKSDAFKDYPLWNANWTSGCPSIPDQWSEWRFWQYSATGTVDGIDDDVDLDKFNGSLADLEAYVASVCQTNCPDARCHAVPEGTTLCADAANLGTCQGGMLTTQACTTACVAGGDAPRCVDTACFANLGSADGSYCEDAGTLVTCQGGARQASACTGTAICVADGGAASCRSGPPEGAEAADGPDGGDGAATGDDGSAATTADAEATEAPDSGASESGPEVTLDPTAATPLPAARAASFSATETPESGCAGGTDAGIGGALAVALAGLASRIRRGGRARARTLRCLRRDR